MTREQVVRLTILTACIYAFSMYMQKGTWIFPFPLYESAMLAAMIALYIVGRTAPGIIGFLALSWSVLQLCTSDFILEFFITSENADWFFANRITDYVLLAFLVIFTSWAAIVALSLRKQAVKLIALLCCLAFPVLFFYGEYLWAIAPLTGLLVCLYADQREASIHRDILFLFTFFFLSKYLTLIFLGE
jgi:hypothetical protein